MIWILLAFISMVYKMSEATNKIKAMLDRLVMEQVVTLAEQVAPNALNGAQMGAGNVMHNANRLDLGRTAIVNRVRGGQIQMRKTVSQTQGYKIVDGGLVKMSPEEMRRRKFAAKISARKRRSMVAQIVRNRKISLRKRDSRFGS